MEANRTTAGIPGLSPQARSRNDTFWRNRETTRKTYAESEAKRTAAAGTSEDRKIEAKRGIDLPGYIFMLRLKKLNPGFIFERSEALPENMGIYYMHPLRGQTFITAFPAEHVYEFETKKIDENGNPKMPIRGWRTVLIKLIRGKFITELGAYALFGPPSRDNENWALYLEHRQPKPNYTI